VELVGFSLFGWHVGRDFKFGDRTVGELESRGVVFVAGAEPHLTIKLPLVLLLFAAEASQNVPMLLSHLAVALGQEQNERVCISIVALKCAALKQMSQVVTPGALFGSERHFDNMNLPLEFDSCKVVAAQKQITKATWAEWLKGAAARGVFAVNAPSSPFADAVVVPKGGEWAIVLRETATRQQLQDRTVLALSLSEVREEHEKCRVATPHLFVLVTDEDFAESAALEQNEIVVSFRRHAAVMGPLLALLRKYNHSGPR
jgi:hypothetical protein